MDASNATAKELSHAARKICGEDGFLREPSSFTSDTLGYGAILEGREAAYIIINAIAAPSALQETSSSTNCLTAACSPRRHADVRDGLFLETVPFSANLQSATFFYKRHVCILQSSF